MKKNLAKLAAGAMLSLCLPLTAQAQTAVDVSLPAFTVTLNGIAVDAIHSEYPFLVYKDITYVPMTYHDARLLGLETNWSEAKGLTIRKAVVFDAQTASGAYTPYQTETANGSTYQATIVESAVTVQDEVIENSAEEYPLLSFRDVTYFPLTWRFAHDTFGWQYSFDGENGLRITPRSTVGQTVTASGGKVTVTGSVVNVRADNNTEAVVVGQVNKGATLSFTAKKDGWYQVVLPSGQSGWLAGWLAEEQTSSSSAPTISTTPNTNTSSTTPTTPSTTTANTGRITITGNVVNVRADNNTTSAIVAKVSSGAVFSYTEKKDDWYKVTLSDGKSGWVAGWLATEVPSSNSNNNTNSNTSSNNNTTTTPDTSTSGGKTLELDSAHRLTIGQSAGSTALTVTGVSGYNITKNSESSLTVRINNGNFKPETYRIDGYGIRSITVTGQLMTVLFENDVTYAAKTQNTNELLLTAQSQGGGSFSTWTDPDGNTIVINSLKSTTMMPGEARTTVELAVGEGNAVQVLSTIDGQVVLSIANNNADGFATLNNAIGPLTSLSARTVANNQAEVTLQLQSGAYCVFDQEEGKLSITVHSRNWSTSQGLAGKTIVLDPGHGGTDPGAIGRVLKLTDAEVGLNVCNALKPLLEAAGAQVIMTRNEASGYLGVVERAYFSNAMGADIFVSVHANSVENNTAANGAQVYYYAPDTSPTLASQKPIRMELAQYVSNNIAAQTGRKSDIYTKNLGVLRENEAPSILVETGFLSNREDEALLATPEYIDKLAMGIYQGLVQYLAAK